MKDVLKQGTNCCQHADGGDKKQDCIHKKTQRTCKNLLEVLPSLFTFAKLENVEPTNNAAEQEARFLVIKRKLSFGSKSENGSRFIESMMTAAATLRRQGRHVLTYLVAAIAAALQGEAPPSLLPAVSAQPSTLSPAEPCSTSGRQAVKADIIPTPTRPPPGQPPIRTKVIERPDSAAA